MSGHDNLEGLMDRWYLEDATWSKVRNALLFLALVGWIGCAAGLAMEPERFYRSYLVGFAYSTLTCLGGLFFLQVMYLTGSAWSVTVRRIVEHLVAAIPACAVLFIPVIFGIHHLYEWSHTEEVMKDPILSQKSAFLNVEGFVIRGVVFFAIWSLVAWRITSQSLAQDKDQSIKHMDTAARWSAPGLVFTFLTVSLAAFDWLMSLAPHWYSTIFGLYIFAGGGWTFISTMMIICQLLRKNGILARSITVEHYHDLGKWMFATTAFWSYIAFSQYMLIWYANLPEETIWYKVRWENGWEVLSYLLIVGHFFFPFLMLLARGSKRNLGLMFGMAFWVLFIEYIDLYFVIMPNFYKSPAPHWLDLFGWLAPVATVGVVFWSRFRGKALIPVGDLRLEQALGHQNI